MAQRSLNRAARGPQRATPAREPEIGCCLSPALPFSCVICGLPCKRLVCKSSECKQARTKQTIKTWKTANASYVKQQTALYYAENPARQLAANAAWQKAHPKQFARAKKRAQKNYYSRHVDQCRAVSAAYFSANPGVADFHRVRMRDRVRKARAIFDQLVQVNPAVADSLAGVRDKGRYVIRALKKMGVEVVA